MAGPDELGLILTALFPHIPVQRGAPPYLTKIPGPRRVRGSFRTLLDNLAAVIALHPGCQSASLTVADATLYVSSCPPSTVELRSQLEEWIRLFNCLVEDSSGAVERSESLGLSIYSAVYSRWAPAARESCDKLIAGAERLISGQYSQASADGSPILELREALSSLRALIPEDYDPLSSRHGYRALYTVVGLLWSVRQTQQKEDLGKIYMWSSTMLRDITVVYETIHALTAGETAQRFPQGIQLCWVDLPEPRRFEAQLTEDQLRLLEPTINWATAIDEVHEAMSQSHWPQFWNPHPRPPPAVHLSGTCYVAESAVPHCEVVLVQYLLDKEISAVDYIACAPEPCWVCRAYTEAVYCAYGRPMTLGNDDWNLNAEVVLPWVCPPGASEEVKRLLRDHCLAIIARAVGVLPVQEEQGADEGMETFEEIMDDEEEWRDVPGFVVETICLEDPVEGRAEADC